jgi:hypothetical protein
MSDRVRLDRIVVRRSGRARASETYGYGLSSEAHDCSVTRDDWTESADVPTGAGELLRFASENARGDDEHDMLREAAARGMYIDGVWYEPDELQWAAEEKRMDMISLDRVRLVEDHSQDPNTTYGYSIRDNEDRQAIVVRWSDPEVVPAGGVALLRFAARTGPPEALDLLRRARAAGRIYINHYDNDDFRGYTEEDFEEDARCPRI